MYLYKPGGFQAVLKTGTTDRALGAVALERSDGTRLNMPADGTGSWLLEAADGLHRTPDIRVVGAAATAGDGEFPGVGYQAARTVDLAGRLLVDSPLDAVAAEEHLKRWLGPEQRRLWVRRPGWSEPRFLTVRVAGPCGFTTAAAEDPDDWPRWTIPLRAADPRLYGATEHDLEAQMPAGAHESTIVLPDPGSTAAPWRVSFGAGAVGPQVVVPGTLTSFGLPGYTVPAGQVVVFDSGRGTVSVEGGSVLGYLSGSLQHLSPNASSVKVSKTGGPATEVRVRYRETFL